MYTYHILTLSLTPPIAITQNNVLLLLVQNYTQADGLTNYLLILQPHSQLPCGVRRTRSHLADCCQLP